MGGAVMGAVRTLLRMGAEEAMIVYRRSEKDISASRSPTTRSKRVWSSTGSPTRSKSWATPKARAARSTGYRERS